MRSTMTTALEPLSQTRLALTNSEEDLRDRKVFDRDGQEIGKVDEVFIDPAERRARFISVKSGDFLGIGGKRFLIPVDAIGSVDEERVTVNETRDRILGGPEVASDFGSTTQAGRETTQGAMGGGASATSPTASTATSTNAAGDDMGDTPVVVAVYEWYDVSDPYWSPTYQQPTWR